MKVSMTSTFDTKGSNQEPQKCFEDSLQHHIAYHVDSGSTWLRNGLGIQNMPGGYALMRNQDGYYYWLRYDDRESVIHWDKWAIYRGAVADAAKHMIGDE